MRYRSIKTEERFDHGVETTSHWSPPSNEHVWLSTNIIQGFRKSSSHLGYMQSKIVITWGIPCDD